MVAMNATSSRPGLVLLLWLAIAAVAHADNHDQRVSPVPAVPGHFMDTGRPPVTPEDIEKIRNFVGDVRLSEVGVRSIHEVSVLSTVRGDLTLHLPEITPEYAHALSRHRGYLIVHGPVALSEKCADLLGQHRGSLELPDCRVASAAAVRALCMGNKRCLSLGLEAISEDMAHSLARYEGKLRLRKVRQLDDRVAAVLSGHRGMLELYLLESLSPAAARALADKAGGWTAKLGSPEVPLRLTMATTAALARSSETFSVQNVACDPDYASVLAPLAQRKTGELFVYPFDADDRIIGALRIPNASSQIAVHSESEGKSCGDLTITKGMGFTPALAQALVSRRGGRLELWVKGLSEPVARILACYEGPLELHTTEEQNPADAAVAAFFPRRASIGIPAQWLTINTVDSVLSHRGGLSFFPGMPTKFSFGVVHGRLIGIPHWKWMSTDVFDRLLKYDGPLHLKGEVPVEMAEKLPLHHHPLALGSLPQREAAEPLLRCDGPLFFTRDCNVESIEAARVFASAANRTTVCTSKHLMGPDAARIAAIIVERRGEISLPKLSYISDEALRILSQKEDVRLPPLEDLYVLDEAGRDVAPCDVVSERFATINAEHQPPPDMPRWHSWEHLISGAEGR
ncbi:hypothetical protein EBZ80_23005 [bacterium]|nr:hypothetical protein [bacterium]